MVIFGALDNTEFPFPGIFWRPVQTFPENKTHVPLDLILIIVALLIDGLSSFNSRATTHRLMCFCLHQSPFGGIVEFLNTRVVTLAVNMLLVGTHNKRMIGRTDFAHGTY